MSKNILVIVDGLDRGGIASVVLNISKELETRGYRFDYVCYNLPPENMVRMLHKNKSKIFVIDSVSKSNPFKYIKAISNIVKENGEYSAIHAHTSSFIWLACYAAKKEGIDVRVGHAHGSKNLLRNSLLSKTLFYLFRFINRKYCTNMLTCSKKSGEFTFGKGFEFIPNFVDPNNYTELTKQQRNKYYESFNIPVGKKILGFVGYIGREKNTKFLIPVIKKLIEEGNDSYLILAGLGDGFEEISKLIEKEKLDERVKMLGQRKDVNELLHFFDVLLMPSFSEGMSIALLEAQICSTPCVVSIGVPETNDIGAGLFHICEKYDVREWCETIKKVLLTEKVVTRREIEGVLNNKGYDMTSVGNRISQIYSNNY